MLNYWMNLKIHLSNAIFSIEFHGKRQLDQTKPNQTKPIGERACRPLKWTYSKCE